jgi:nitroimidazol reductase NimA-like FMN-containing flavoprotein (pyridoxamine 5'-phosphate oxidase superfamily)
MGPRRTDRVPKLDLSLSADEQEAFLVSQRTIRLATAAGGRPQVVPLWYVWLDGALFLNSTLGNVTVRNLQRNPEASGVVDDGDSYEELRGVILRGRVEMADDDARVPEVKERWSTKYMGGNPVPYDRWRGRIWMRLTPEGITSWDFRKIPEARARARAAMEAARSGEGDGR